MLGYVFTGLSERTSERTSDTQPKQIPGEALKNGSIRLAED